MCTNSVEHSARYHRPLTRPLVSLSHTNPTNNTAPYSHSSVRYTGPASAIVPPLLDFKLPARESHNENVCERMVQHTCTAKHPYLLTIRHNAVQYSASPGVSSLAYPSSPL